MTVPEQRTLYMAAAEVLRLSKVSSAHSLRLSRAPPLRQFGVCFQLPIAGPHASQLIRTLGCAWGAVRLMSMADLLPISSCFCTCLWTWTPRWPAPKSAHCLLLRQEICWPAEEEGGPSGRLQTGGQGSCNLPGELLALCSGLYPVTSAAAHCRHVNNPTMMTGAC